MKPVQSSIKKIEAAKELIGQNIRAYDFRPVRINNEPQGDYPDVYVEGQVKAVEMIHGSWVYVLECSSCSNAVNYPDKPDRSRVGLEIYAAVELDMMDWEGRINVL